MSQKNHRPKVLLGETKSALTPSVFYQEYGQNLLKKRLRQDKKLIRKLKKMERKETNEHS